VGLLAENVILVSPEGFSHDFRCRTVATSLNLGVQEALLVFC
jgi:hypothetical protein